MSSTVPVHVKVTQSLTDGSLNYDKSKQKVMI